MNVEDLLFIFYIFGFIGKLKGVLYIIGGYLLYVVYIYEVVFDLCEDDIYWCIVDVGWVIGYSYIVYGLLVNGVILLMFEGVLNYFIILCFWEVIDKYQVIFFYIVLIVICVLMCEGEVLVKCILCVLLCLFGSVGELINLEVWCWYYEVVGDSCCLIVDIWWQIEIGGILILLLVGVIDFKFGLVILFFFGVQLVLVNVEGEIQEGVVEGNLIICDFWLGQMCSVYGDYQCFIDIYFCIYLGSYFIGDGCCCDEDGYYWIIGCVDDVINVFGYCIGMVEVESVLVLYLKVVEVVVVGFLYDIKGQGIYVYVILIVDEMFSDELYKELVVWVCKEIGLIVVFDYL